MPIYTKIIVSPIFEIEKVTDDMMKLNKKALLVIKTEDEIGSLKRKINSLAKLFYQLNI